MFRTDINMRARAEMILIIANQRSLDTSLAHTHPHTKHTSCKLEKTVLSCSEERNEYLGLLTMSVRSFNRDDDLMIN